MSRTTRTTCIYGLGHFVVLEALLVLAVYYWPHFLEAIQDSAGTIRILSKAVPVIDDMIGKIAEGSPEEKAAALYVLLQHFFKGCNAVGSAVAVLFAVGAVAGEVHRGTFELLLSRPISRRRYLLERYAGGVLGVLLPVFATTATIPPLLDWVDTSVPGHVLALCAVHQALFLLALYSLAFLISTLASNPWHVAFGFLGFFLFEFAVYMVEVVTNYSLYRLADLERYEYVYDQGALEWTYVAGFTLFSAACLALSLRAFERRIP